jgi:hypothetical protein
VGNGTDSSGIVNGGGQEAADAVGISRSIAYEHWSYAKVRLKTLLDSD